MGPKDAPLHHNSMKGIFMLSFRRSINILNYGMMRFLIEDVENGESAKEYI